MRRSWLVLRFFALLLCPIIFVACAHDPNARKKAYFDSGMRYFQKGDFKNASIQFSNAVRLDASYAAAHRQLAFCSLRQGAWNEAFIELQRTVQLNPEDMGAELELSKLLLRAGKASVAQERVKVVLQKDDRSTEAHALLAQIKAAQKEYHEARAEISRAIELAPTQANLYIELATIQAEMNDPEAGASFRRAAALAPTNLTASLCLATYYFQQKANGAAEQEFKRAIQIEPKNPIARLMLARFYASLNRPFEAESLLRQAQRELSDNPKAYRMLADYYLSSGQFDKALQELQTLYAAHPKDVGVAKSYVDALLSRHQLQLAQEVNSRLEGSQPMDNEVLVYKAAILSRQNNPEEALRILAGVLRDEPGNARALYEQGIAQEVLGNSEQAVASWKAALEANPRMAPALLALCQNAIRTADANELNQFASRLIQFEPGRAEGYLYRAKAQIVKRSFAAAETDLQKALSLAPNTAPPYVGLAELKSAQEQYAAAKQYFEQALERDPAAEDALHGLALTYLAQNQWQDGVHRVLAQIEKVPERSGFYATLGTLYASARQWDKAEVAFIKSRQLAPNLSNTSMLLGQVQLSRGAVAQAAATWQDWAQKFPRDVRPWILLGTLEEGRQRYHEAAIAYRRVLELQPDNPIAANNLAFLMLQTGENTSVALSLAQTARRQMPQSATTADTLAWAYYKTGAYASAVELMEEAVRQAPNNANYHYHFGMALKAVSKPTEARIQFMQALRLQAAAGGKQEIELALAALGRA